MDGQKNRKDKEFENTEFAQKIKWLAKDNEDIYDPDYGDMLRVAFMYSFNRGRLAPYFAGTSVEKIQQYMDIDDIDDVAALIWDLFEELKNCFRKGRRQSLCRRSRTDDSGQFPKKTCSGMSSRKNCFRRSCQ